MLGLLNLFMIAIGFVIGVLSGFFGFGGGFILTPLLISLDFPASISVGTSIMETFMSSLVNSLRHRFLGNVKIKAGLAAVSSSILGSEFGAQIIERLKILGVQYMGFVLSLSYIIILGLISAYIFHESLKWRHLKEESSSLGRKFEENGPLSAIIILRPNIEKVSMWIFILIGFISGFFAGFLGSGGGFILITLLIYVVGYKPRVIAGTSAFWVLLNSAYASLTHIIKGNVNFILATLIFIGSSAGMQIGIAATRHVKKDIFKLLFGLCLGFVSLSTFIKLLSESPGLSVLHPLPPIITFILVSTVALLIIIELLNQIIKKKED